MNESSPQGSRTDCKQSRFVRTSSEARHGRARSAKYIPHSKNTSLKPLSRHTERETRGLFKNAGMYEILFSILDAGCVWRSLPTAEASFVFLRRRSYSGPPDMFAIPRFLLSHCRGDVWCCSTRNTSISSTTTLGHTDEDFFSPARPGNHRQICQVSTLITPGGRLGRRRLPRFLVADPGTSILDANLSAQGRRHKPKRESGGPFSFPIPGLMNILGRNK